MVGSLSAGLLLADEAGAHLPSVDDFLPPEILFQGTPFAINRIILIRIVATIVLLVVLGVTAKRAKLIPGRWQGVVEYGLDFVRDKVVYDVMGETRGKRYVPMITTLFFTIFVFNLTVTEAGRLASWLHDMADGRWRDHNGYVPEVVK